MRFIKLLNLLWVMLFCSIVQANTDYLELKLSSDLLAKSEYITVVIDDNQNKYIEYKNSLSEPVVEKLDCIDINAANRQKYRAVWLWDYKKALDNPTTTIKKLKDIGVNMVFIQISDNLYNYSDFIEIANDNNIKVSALTGEPNFIYNEVAINNLRSVLDYNKNNNHKFEGFQIDVEPYTLEGFEINKSEIIEKYIELTTLLHNNKNNLEFSVVLPFWFSDLKDKNGKDYIDYVYKNVDFVSIMSYRTNYKNILNISNNSLCIAAKADKNVLLSIEILPLPDETHITFSSEEIRKYISDKDGVKTLTAKVPLNSRINEVRINSSDISFNNNIQSGLSTIDNKKPPYLAFLGWSINGIENYLFK